LGGTLIAVTDTFFPVSVERLGLIVQEMPMHDEGQQFAEELVEVEELVVDEPDAEAHETEMDAEAPAVAAAAVEVDEVDDVAATEDFHACVGGHQAASEPGPGPGPSLGPFCSDILSWLRCCKLVIQHATSRSRRERTASLRRIPSRTLGGS